jgi:hypothetical protein
MPSRGRITLLLTYCFLLTACGHNAAAGEPSAVPTVVVTKPTPTVAATEFDISEEKRLEYEIVYEEDGFKIREAFLGSAEDWTWMDFAIPQARIQHTVQDLGLDALCDSTTAEWQATGWCTDTVEIKTTNEQKYRFDLACDSMMGGHCYLRRNGTLVWEGDLHGGTCRPIHSSRRIRNDIAIDYTNVVTSGQTTVHSILLTKGNDIVDITEATGYDAAFAPGEVLGKLVYFASEYLPDRKVLLIFDGREVAQFDAVFNQYCCWDGPPVQIYGNGEIVDFFAQKDDGWYHIQAGNLASLS